MILKMLSLVKQHIFFRDRLYLAGSAKTELIWRQRDISQKLVSPFPSCATFGKSTQLSKTFVFSFIKWALY